MRRTIERLEPLAYAMLFLLLLPLAQQALAALGRLRAPMACECLGPEGASVNVVYLHGLDTRGPSFIELQNRATLRALANELHLRIALPRAGGAWPQHGSEAVRRSLGIIDDGAAACFPGRPFGLLAFSNGGNLANELFVQVRHVPIRWIVSVGSEGSLPRASPSLADRVPMRLIDGRHDPTFNNSRGFARQLASHGADARFIEHPGPHELPFAQTLAVLAELDSTARTNAR